MLGYNKLKYHCWIWNVGSADKKPIVEGCEEQRLAEMAYALLYLA